MGRLSADGCRTACRGCDPQGRHGSWAGEPDRAGAAKSAVSTAATTPAIARPAAAGGQAAAEGRPAAEVPSGPTQQTGSDSPASSVTKFGPLGAKNPCWFETAIGAHRSGGGRRRHGRSRRLRTVVFESACAHQL